MPPHKPKSDLTKSEPNHVKSNLVTFSLDFPLMQKTLFLVHDGHTLSSGRTFRALLSCSFVSPHLAPALHIPHKIAGAFGYLCGYGTLDDCKTCVRECIDEFDAVTDMSQHDYVSAQLFSVLRAVRAQFVSFGATPRYRLAALPRRLSGGKGASVRIERRPHGRGELVAELVGQVPANTV